MGFFLIKHVPLPWGNTTCCCYTNSIIFYRGCSGQHHLMSTVTAFPLQFCAMLESILYSVIVRRVCEYSLLQLVKIYGFCEDDCVGVCVSMWV